MATTTLSLSNSTTPPTSLFEEDDESTLNILISPSLDDVENSSNSDLSSRLSSMRNRLASDVQQRDSGRGSYWDDLIQTSVVSHRFHVPDESGGVLQKSSSSTATDSGWKMPASFDSKKGRDHLSAVRGLLRGSVPDDASAVRLSMSALRSLASVGGEGDVTATGGSSDGDGNSNNGGLRLRSLLGTRRLLTLVVEHHHRQTLARIRAITECLRIEQDQDDEGVNQSLRDSCVELLDSIDASYESGGNRRGLFRFLLTIACGNVSLLAREDLARVAELRCDDE
eukprot:2170606-Ditylum_brightwellii.AAC.1